MLKRTFFGLQRCHWQYESIVIRLTVVVASQICEIPRNSPKTRTYSRSSQVIDLDALPVESAHATSY